MFAREREILSLERDVEILEECVAIRPSRLFLARSFQVLPPVTFEQSSHCFILSRSGSPVFHRARSSRRDEHTRCTHVVRTNDARTMADGMDRASTAGK